MSVKISYHVINEEENILDEATHINYIIRIRFLDKSRFNLKQDP